MAAAIAAPPPASTPKNFHDNIRSMFSGISSAAATSTTSLAYTLENGAKSAQAANEQASKFQGAALTLLQQQIVLLKKLVSKTGGLFGGIGSSLLADGIEGLGKSLLKRIFGPLFSKVGKALGITAAVEFLGGLKNNMVKGLEATAKNAGSFVVRTVAKTASAAFKVVEGAGKLLFAPIMAIKNLIFSSGAIKGITAAAEGVGSFLVGGTKLIGRMLGKLAWPITAFFALIDGVTGWMNSDSILGKAAGTSSITDKLSAAAGSIINGFLFGIPNWLVKQFGGDTLSKVFANGFDMVKSALGPVGSKIAGIAVEMLFFPFALIPSAFKMLIGNGDEIKQGVYRTFETVKDGIWNGLTSFASSLKDSVEGVFKDMWDAVTGWWNSPPGTKPPSFRNSATGGVRPAPAYLPPGPGGRGVNTPNTSTTTGQLSAGSAVPGTPAVQGYYSVGTDGVMTPLDPSTTQSVGGATPNLMSTTPSTARSSLNTGLPAGTNANGAAVVGAPVVGGAQTTYASGSGATLTGKNASENAKSTFNFLTAPQNQGGMGYTSEQARGVIAGLQGESGKKLNTSLDEMDTNGKRSIGMAQWNGERGDRLKDFASKQGKDWTDINVQHQFLKQELLSSESGADARIRNSTTAAQATDGWVRGFERPKFADQQVAVRSGNLDGLQVVTSPQSPSGAASVVNPTAGSPAMANGAGPLVGAPVKMMNNGQRNLDIQPNLKQNLSTSVKQLFGDGYSVNVISGGQGEGSNGRTGSNRHNDGHAGDVQVMDPNGKPISDEQRASLGQYWLAKNYGSVGLGMQQGSVHLDDFTKSKLGSGQSLIWDYNQKGGRYFDPALKAQAAQGMKGILPQLAYTDDQMKTMGNAGGANVQSIGIQPNGGVSALLSGKQNPTQDQINALKNANGVSIDSPTTSVKPLPSYDSFFNNDMPAQAPPPPIPQVNSNTGPIAAQSNGKNTGGDRTPGSYNVSEIPVLDEYKMTLANGSAVT